VLVERFSLDDKVDYKGFLDYIAELIRARNPTQYASPFRASSEWSKMVRDSRDRKLELDGVRKSNSGALRKKNKPLPLELPADGEMVTQCDVWT